MLKRKISFVKRHYDFLAVDLIAFLVGYLIALLFRRSLHLTLNFQEFVPIYGVTAVFSFLLVEVLSENLNGVITRGFIREAKKVISQMTLTWCVYLTLLFLMHIIFSISRIFTVSSYAICLLFVLAFRTAWKLICKYTKAGESMLPKLLIVCDAEKAQAVLERLLNGTFNNEYEICGLVVNEGELNYSDHYPIEAGLNNIGNHLQDDRIQEAFIELTDADEETRVIEELLKAGVVLHRSLGDSKLHYARQNVDEFSGSSVVTISGNNVALASKADKIWQEFRRKISRD